MSGSIKVGGHTVFVHTGASGAGTLSVQGQNGNTLLTDDGTAVSLGNNVRLPASGGIKDSSGNNVLTESSGNVSLGNVRLPATGGIKDSSGNNVLSESGGAVTFENVTIGTSTKFPPNILIDYKTARLQGRYLSGNVYRTWANMPSGLWMNITGLPTRKRIVVRYSIYAIHGNHATMHCKYGWNSQANVVTFVPTGYGSGGQAGINWSADIPVKYPLGKFGYNTDPNTVMAQHMIFEFYDTNSSNTALYLTPVYLSEGSTSDIYINGTVQNNTGHGSVVESYGEIYVYSY